MPEPLSADQTAEMLLWCFEEPARYRAEGRRRDAPLLESEAILKLALGRRGHFEDRALDEPGNAALLQQAAAAYVRLLFFRPEATPYQTLGLAPDASPEAIKESFRLLMHLVHPDRQEARALWPDVFAAQANRAYALLRNPDSRAKFDREAATRAAMARAVNRPAASADSMMPGRERPKSRLGRRRFVPSKLPEWLTAGVVGYVRSHPAATVFTVFIAAALLTVVAMISEGPEGRLVREVQDIQEAAAPTILAAVQAVTTAAATAADAFGSAESSNSDVPSTRSDATGAAAHRVAAVPAAPQRAFATPTRTDESAVPPVPEAPETNLPVTRAPPPETIAQAPLAVVAEASPTLATVTPAAMEPPPATSELEMLFVTFVESYERGRVDAFAALFDDDADTDLRHGRAAIRGEYDELFRMSQWRKMHLTRVNWRRAGDRAFAKGEIIVTIGWRDGREDERSLPLDMEIVRRDGRAVIAKLSHQPKN